MLKRGERLQQLAAMTALLACGFCDCTAGDQTAAANELPAMLRPAGPPQLTRVNGVLLQLVPMASDDEPDEVRRAMARTWRIEPGAADGGWRVASRQVAGRNAVLQMRAAADGGTEALFSVTDLRAAPTRPASPLLPLPRGTQIQRVTEVQDAGQVSVLTGHAALAVPPFTARVIATARQQGWQAVCAAVDAAATSCQFERGAQWAQLQLTPDHGGAALVLVQSGARSRM